jgi:5-methyltetrahydropteroyltriglutamate--homocysteine methyltransferase
MDADVISIETNCSMLRAPPLPERHRPGVYDIHSPRVPDPAEMLDLHKALDVLQPKQLWINPDCGLKTRDWPEVEQALSHMVASTRLFRSTLAANAG